MVSECAGKNDRGVVRAVDSHHSSVAAKATKQNEKESEGEKLLS